MILSAEDLSYSYGDRLLFENITFNVEEGDKYGIIGVNGTGKSTLLRMIAHHEAGDGKLTIPGGVVMEYLPQDPPFEADATVLEQVFKGDSPLMVLLRDYETAVEQAAAELITKSCKSICLICSSRWMINMPGSWKAKRRQCLRSLALLICSSRWAS